MQPGGGTIAGLLQAGMGDPRYDTLDAAVAYVTASGVGALKGGDPAALDHLQRRWLSSFDWCRSDPVALRSLDQGNSSKVRIHDGAVVVEKPGCNPALPFHPKGFLFCGQDARLLISGSGNLSDNGILRGVELDTVIEVQNPQGAHELEVWAVLEGVRARFDDLWNNASNYAGLNDRYQEAFAQAAANPPRTDDDWSKVAPLPRGFTELDLVRMRRSNVFWTEAGNLTENLGAGNPGSQLMTKALTRVFFGFPATDRPRQSPLGSIDIRYGASITAGLSMEYAHNRMDRLNLPHPGPPGPPEYDQKTLVFTKVAYQGRIIYDLKLATSAEKRSLQARSKEAHSAFTMPGGRRFGFCPS